MTSLLKVYILLSIKTRICKGQISNLRLQVSLKFIVGYKNKSLIAAILEDPKLGLQFTCIHHLVHNLRQYDIIFLIKIRLSTFTVSMYVLIYIKK